jgi:hypothetical protein
MAEDLDQFLTDNFHNVYLRLNGNMQCSPSIEVIIVMENYRLKIKSVKNGTRLNFEFQNNNIITSDEYRTYQPIKKEFDELYKNITIDECKKVCLEFKEKMLFNEIMLLMKQLIKVKKMEKDFK